MSQFKASFLSGYKSLEGYPLTHLDVSLDFNGVYGKKRRADRQTILVKTIEVDSVYKYGWLYVVKVTGRQISEQQLGGNR